MIPDVGSFSVAVSVHWEDEYAPFTLTGIEDLYAVTALVAAWADPIESPEANTKSTRIVEAERTLSFDFVSNFALADGACQRN